MAPARERQNIKIIRKSNWFAAPVAKLTARQDARERLGHEWEKVFSLCMKQ
jgi:hypothetical protein